MLSVTHNEKLINLEERNICAQDFRSSKKEISGAFVRQMLKLDMLYIQSAWH